jgi:hypothetical protein
MKLQIRKAKEDDRLKTKVACFIFPIKLQLLLAMFAVQNFDVIVSNNPSTTLFDDAI